MKRIAVIIAAVMVLLFVTGCGSPEQSVKMFLKYRLGNENVASKLYCTDSVEERLDSGELTLQYLGFDKPFGVHISWPSVKGSIQLLVESQTETTARVVFQAELGDVVFDLNHEGGMWKINTITGATDKPETEEEEGEPIAEPDGT